MYPSYRLKTSTQNCDAEEKQHCHLVCMSLSVRNEVYKIALQTSTNSKSIQIKVPQKMET